MPSSLIYERQEARLKEYGEAIRDLQSRVNSQSANLRAGERERKLLAGELVALRNEVGSLRKALLETMEAIHVVESKVAGTNQATPARRLADQSTARARTARVS